MDFGEKVVSAMFGLMGLLSAGVVTGTLISEKKAEKAYEKFKKEHQPEEQDYICRRCKNICSISGEKQGYGMRADKMKYTFYCSTCGSYYNVWR